MPKINVKKQAVLTKPPLIANDNAFLGDVFSSNAPADEQIVCGFFRQEKGKPLVYKYEYDEMKIVLQGTMKLSDETGYEVIVQQGDVLYFEKGTTVTFEALGDFCLNFYSGKRAVDSA